MGGEEEHCPPVHSLYPMFSARHVCLSPSVVSIVPLHVSRCRDCPSVVAYEWFSLATFVYLWSTRRSSESLLVHFPDVERVTGKEKTQRRSIEAGTHSVGISQLILQLVSSHVAVGHFILKVMDAFEQFMVLLLQVTDLGSENPTACRRGVLSTDASPTGLVRVYRGRHDVRLHYFVVHSED